MNDKSSIDLQAQAPDPYGSDTVHAYAALGQGNRFNSRVDVNGKDYILEAQGGVVRAPGPAARVIDELLERGDHPFTRMLRKIDRERAEQSAREFVLRQRAAAQRGATTTESANLARGLAANASGRLMAEGAPNNPEALEELQRGLLGADLALTERVDPETGQPLIPPGTEIPDTINPAANPMDAAVPGAIAARTAAGGIQLNVGGAGAK